MRLEKEQKRRTAGFFSSMTVALGILSPAAAPHRYTLLHVCSVAAGVCSCFVGAFLFNSARRAVIRPCWAPVLAETLSLLHCTALHSAANSS